MRINAAHTRWDSGAAFTLVEMLVVIFITSLLIALLLPALSMARKRALAVDCASNMRQCWMAYAYYANVNDGLLPPLQTGSPWYFPNIGSYNVVGGRQVISYGSGPNGYLSDGSMRYPNEIPAAFACPVALATGDPYANMHFSDGRYFFDTYVPDLYFWANQVPGASAAYSPRLDAPIALLNERWPDVVTIVDQSPPPLNPGDAVMLGEANLPEYWNGLPTPPNSLLAYNGMTMTPDTPLPNNFYPYLWAVSSVAMPGSSCRFGWWHGSADAGYMNTAYFDGHVAPLNEPNWSSQSSVDDWAQIWQGLR